MQKEEEKIMSILDKLKPKRSKEFEEIYRKEYQKAMKRKTTKEATEKAKRDVESETGIKKIIGIIGDIDKGISKIDRNLERVGEKTGFIDSKKRKKRDPMSIIYGD